MTLDPKRWEGHARGPFDVIVGDDLSKPITVIDADDNDIADVWSRDGATVFINREQAIATARLFSDAPALAAAYVRLTAENAQLRETLKKIVNSGQTLVGYGAAPDDKIYGDSALARIARAALAGGAQRQGAAFGECSGCAGMGWHLPVTCGLDDEQAGYIVCTVCGNPHDLPFP